MNIRDAKQKYLKGGTLNKKRINIDQVNEAIQKVYPGVFLVKDKGYFFVASDDEKMALRIAGLYQSGIYVARLNELSIERWVDEVRHLMEAPENF